MRRRNSIGVLLRAPVFHRFMVLPNSRQIQRARVAAAPTMPNLRSGRGGGAQTASRATTEIAIARGSGATQLAWIVDAPLTPAEFDCTLTRVEIEGGFP